MNYGCSNIFRQKVVTPRAGWVLVGARVDEEHCREASENESLNRGTEVDSGGGDGEIE
jgi:hypothetical protein